MDMVIQLCESGYLVITSLHATDTKQSIERIIKMYPPEYQNTIQKTSFSYTKRSNVSRTNKEQR